MVRRAPRRYSLGIDLGQSNDPTAVAVIEKTYAPAETAMFPPVGEEPGNRIVEGDVLFNLVYLRRVQLHTPYTTIAERVAALCLKLEPKGAFDEQGQLTAAVDATGVGRPVVDVLRKEFADRAAEGYFPKIDFRGVNVTGSNTSTRKPKTPKEYWSVPKHHLIFGAVTALEQNKLSIARDIRDKDVLVDELKNFRWNVNINGNVQFEPWRTGAHDDLLFAVTLAHWAWRQPAPNWNMRVVA